MAKIVAHLYGLLFQSDRRLAISWLAVLPHHRTYGSVYGGSEIYTLTFW